MSAPWLLWLSGVVTLGVGYWQASAVGIGFGAAMMIAGLLLPRLKGAFELGPQGIKGSLSEDFLQHVALVGAQRGLSAAKVVELVDNAQQELDAVPGFPELPAPVPQITREVTAELAQRFVENAVGFENLVQEVLERGTSHGTLIERQPPNPVTSARTADYLLVAKSTRVLVETYFTRNPSVFQSRSGRFATALYRSYAMVNDYDAAHLYLVVPARMDGIPDPPPSVSVVTPEELEVELARMSGDRG